MVAPTIAVGPKCDSAEKNSDPLRQIEVENPKIALFLEKFATVRQFSLAGGGGGGVRKIFDLHALLPLRQLPSLAD